MKITKFNRIKARTYKDFAWPADLPEFADYNLIYGWNGSGKTTLADILRMVEKRQSIGEEGIHEFSITCDGKTISNANVATDTAPPSVRVFNRAFVEKNVFAEDGALAIFFIGEENIDEQKKLEQLKKDLALLRTNSSAKKSEKDKKEKEVEKLCQDKATETRKWLSMTSQTGYHKTHFSDGCDALIAGGNAQQHVKTSEEMDALKITIAGTVQDEIPHASLDFPDLQAVADEVKTSLQKTVVSQTIDALTKDQAISDWVKDGLKIHNDHKSETCKFCEQTLPATRIKELEGHFNHQFQQLESLLNSKVGEVSQKIDALNSFKAPDATKFYPDLATKYKVSCQALDDQISGCTKFLGLLKTALEDKKGKPFASVDFNSSVPVHGPDQLAAVNAFVTEHNNRTKNFTQEINAAKHAIKSAFAAEVLTQYKELKSRLETLETEYNGFIEKIKLDEAQVNILEEELINHKKPAEDINKDLQNYLGHNELQFATGAKDTGYTIMRGDKPASAISEGEKTAIALLHFLKSLEDTKFKLESGIVVVDDPVCSMDDTALFHAFSYIKERTKNAKQLFILTHNFAFFRQVKNWFWHVNKHKKKLGKSASFYQTVCISEGGARVSKLRQLDKLLHEYNSEYQYLFDMTYKSSSAVSVGSGLSQYYHMPNVARRLLEAFLAFRMPGTTGELHNKMDQSTFMSAKKTGILRFLHTHSHEDQIGYSEHDSTILAETPQIMTDILEFIKFEDEKHYNEMILLVAPPPIAPNTYQTASVVSA